MSFTVSIGHIFAFAYCSLTMLKPLTVWIATNCGKFFKRWKYQITLPAFWEICMQVMEQQLESDMNNRLIPNWDRSTSRLYILSPWLSNLHAEHIMWNARLDEAQAGIKTAGRNINNLRYADDTTLKAESEEELESLLMKVKECEKA